MRAIQNVKKYYAVVGLTEEFEQFVEALDYVLPTFFKGVSLVYKSMSKFIILARWVGFLSPTNGRY